LLGGQQVEREHLAHRSAHRRNAPPQLGKKWIGSSKRGLRKNDMAELNLGIEILAIVRSHDEI
jgi:hypothetical protein